MCEISGNGSLKYFSRPRNFFWRWKCVKFVVGSLARPGFHPFGWGGAGALPRVSAAQRENFFWGSIFLNENCILGVFFLAGTRQKKLSIFQGFWTAVSSDETYCDILSRFQTFSNGGCLTIRNELKRFEEFWRRLNEAFWKKLQRCWNDAEAMLKRCWKDVEAMLKRCWNDVETMLKWWCYYIDAIKDDLLIAFFFWFKI